MRKKILIGIVCSLIILLVTATSFANNNDFSISVSSSSATNGDKNVVINILLGNNPGIDGFSFCVDYDNEKLTLVDSEITIPFGIPTIGTASGHDIAMMWISTEKYADNGVFATLTFSANEDAEIGQADICINYRSGYDSFYYIEDNVSYDIVVTTNDGYINVSHDHNYSEWSKSDTFDQNGQCYSTCDICGADGNKSVNQIILATGPSCTLYLEGTDTIQVADAELLVMYSDASAEAVLVTNNMISMFNGNTVGKQTVTISYGGKTCTFDVTVQAKSLDHIAITSAPAITTYVEGQIFDPAGMVVIAYYDNGTVATVTDYEYSPDAFLKSSDTYVTISFNGKSVTQDIIVLEPYVLSMSGTQYSLAINVTSQPLFILISEFSDTLSGKFVTSTMTKITDAQVGVPIVNALPEGQYVISIVNSQFVPLTNCISNIGLYE